MIPNPGNLKPILLVALLLSGAVSAAAQDPPESTVENLRAFAKLYGYVRFFHPSDEAAANDWSTFAVYGAEKVMAVSGPGELKPTLEELFLPLAPTLRIFAVGEAPPEAEYDDPKPAEGLKRVAWQHCGVGLWARSPYLSARTNRITPQGQTFDRLFDALPDADATVRKEIGAGLQISMPLVLRTDGGTTLGKRPGDATARLRETLAGFDTLGRGDADAATHVAAVTVAWNVFQHFYPYFDTVDVDWDAELRARLAGALEARQALGQLHNLQRLAAALQDGHSRVYSPELEAHQAGLPWALAWIEGEVVVTASQADGVERGDVVVSVDGVAARELVEREMELCSGSPQRRRYVALLVLGRGEASS